ncbi:hypothetical protein IV40_GL001894 [Lactobacillus selangorensis]|nr:hypothetical protein IV40_GL001894 [Lactobacillus selangorensis]
MDSITDSLEDKAIGYAKVNAQLKADAASLKEEETRLHDRRVAIENKQKLLKEALSQAMIETDQRKFKTPLFSIYIQKNPVKMVISDRDKIDKNYFHNEEVLDSSALKDDLKAGKQVDGAELQQTESVRIR